MRFSVNFYSIAFLISVFVSYGVQSQEIWIEDKITGETLEGVLVFDQDANMNTVSDAFGRVDLKNFPSDCLVNFNLLGYQSLVIPIQELNNDSRIVKMISADEVWKKLFSPLRVHRQLGIKSRNKWG